MRPALAATFGSLGSLAGTVGLALTWVLVDVYVLGHVDPKFGAFGTVQLVAFIAVLSGLVGAAGAYPAHWAFLRQHKVSKPLVPFFTGVVAGAGLALSLRWLLQLDVSPLPEIVGLVGVVALAGFIINISLCILIRQMFREARTKAKKAIESRA